MKKFVEKIEKNRYVRFISIVAVVIGAFITIVNFFGTFEGYLYSNIFIAKNIGDKINGLSAGQSINYFKQSLGSEKLQRDVSEKYIEYIFQYKSSYIQTLVDKKNSEVAYWAITYCGNDPVVIKRQIFQSAGRLTKKIEKNDNLENIIDKSEKIFGDLYLNKSSFTDFYKNEKGDFKYFIGVTANSYAYESLYLGNPSAYQTVIVGVNDICPSADSLSMLATNNNASQEIIEKFRQNSRLNTYGETSPFYGDDILKLLDAQHSNEPNITFGVDRIKVRYFNE